MTSEPQYRIEHDWMGDVRVPLDAKWRAQTQRAVENFPVSGLAIDRDLIAALASIKGAAAAVNAELGVIDPAIAQGDQRCRRRGRCRRNGTQFPIDVFQTGSGTSTNMNANEVIATLATEKLGAPVHPNDHVNASQSSNDTFPSAIHIAATRSILVNLVPALDHLEASLARKATEFATVVKSGRTHLMDATPVTLGQEFGGYAASMRLGVERLLSRAAAHRRAAARRHRGRYRHQHAAGFAAKVIARLADVDAAAADRGA